MLLRLAVAAMALSLLTSLGGCSKSADEPTAEDALLATPVPPGMVRGTVLETMNSGGYTYVFMDTGQDQRWIASLETTVQVGDVVQTDQGMPMQGFTSKTLNRTFNVVYFVGGLENLTGGAQAPAQASGDMPPGHPDISGAGQEASATGEMPAGHPDIGGGEQAGSATVAVAAYEEGRDIAYVYANKDELAGKPVTLRGKVVKYNAGILGWNFIHIQDGSGDAAAGNNDLIVTTTADAAVGQTLVLSGTLVLDKDFGAGYSYPVLLEDASIASE